MTQRRNFAPVVLTLLVVFTWAGCGDDDSSSDEVREVECPAVTFVGGGPEPMEFLGDDLLLGIATVYPAYAAGKRFVIIDARPPSDFNLHHIEGAISLPFYDVKHCVEQLPKDVWYITYCACPHNESVHAAEVLQENGFDKVKVLDEGYIAWRTCGYATSDFPEGNTTRSCDDSTPDGA